MTRVVVVTGDPLGARMAGPAIRAWEMCRELAGAGHEVVLATLDRCDASAPTFRTVAAGLSSLRELEAWCDVLVFQGYLLTHHPWLAESGKVLVADVYDPFHLESLEWERHSPEATRWANLQGSVDALNTQLRRADFLLCASDKQRSFWLGQLAGLGRLNPATYDADETMASLIDVAPFGTSADAPVQSRRRLKGVVPGIAPDDQVLLWGGGVYNWFDPLTLLRAVAELVPTHPRLRLVFLGMKHPSDGIPEMRMALETRRLAEELGLEGRSVFFTEQWVPYAERQDWLLDADVGVSCHLDHVETAFSFRTRILDYLWAGLPIVCTAGDSFGELVTERDLGVAVPPGDVAALAGALASVLDDPERTTACRRRVAEVAPMFCWQRALQPLLTFCADPRRAPDLVRAAVDAPACEAAPDAAVGVVQRLRRDAGLARHYLRHEGVGGLARRARGRLAKREQG